MANTTQIISYLKSNYRLKIEDASFAFDWIPRYVLLDRTRNIHSYLVPCYVNNGLIYADVEKEYDLSSIIVNLVKAQYSQLDRPLFFIISDEYIKNIKVIEGNEIRDMLLEHTITSEETNKYILRNAYGLNDIINRLYKEL